MNQHIAVKYADTAGTEFPVFRNEPVHHQPVRFQKILYG